MIFTNEYKIKIILIFNHIAVAVGLFVADYHWLILSLVGWILINRVGGEIGLHRYFSHGSFKTSKWKEKLLFILATFNCVGSPMMWVGIHRKHHVTSDTEKDPHGSQSILRVWSTFWKPFTIEPKYLVNMMRSPTHKFFHKYYFTILVLTYVLLGLIAWQLPVFLISMSSLITIHSAGLVNSMCHRYGYRNFKTKDLSTNNTIINILTLGSGLHNNHHADPMNYSNKVKKYEFDFPAWIIKNFLMQGTNNDSSQINS
jgi:sn-1 stearoyl-lipid 9-desaturase